MGYSHAAAADVAADKQVDRFPLITTECDVIFDSTSVSKLVAALRASDTSVD